MGTSIRAIAYTTPQRSSLVRFYREGLGLGDPEHSSGEEVFRLGDLTLGISSGDSRLRAPMPRVSLTFVVDDLEEQVSHLKAMGVPFDIEPSADGRGGRRAVCRDPDGNFVSLSSSGRAVKKSRASDDGRPSKASRHKANKTRKADRKRQKKAKPQGKKKKRK